MMAVGAQVYTKEYNLDVHGIYSPECLNMWDRWNRKDYTVAATESSNGSKCRVCFGSICLLNPEVRSYATNQRPHLRSGRQEAPCKLSLIVKTTGRLEESVDYFNAKLTT